MAQILNRSSTLGGQIGDITGRTLADSLQYLTQKKMQDIEDEQYLRAAEDVGIDRRMAKFLRYQSPQSQEALLRKLSPGGGKSSSSKAPQEQMGQYEEQPSYNSQVTPAKNKEAAIKNIAPLLENISPKISPRKKMANDIESIQQAAQAREQQKEIESSKKSPDKLVRQQEELRKREEKIAEHEQKKLKSSINKTPNTLPKQDRAVVKEINKIIDQPIKTSPSIKAQEKIDENPDPVKHKAVQEKQNKEIKKLPKLSEKEQIAADKETKPYFDDISKGYKAAKEGNIRLDRMLELIKEGNLVWPSIASFLDTLDRGIPLFGSHVGIDLHFLENADTHEFRKLSTDFIKNAKDIFGSRVTNLDLETFLKTIPNVSQTDEGKVRVIRNIRLINSGNIIRKKAMDEIIEENDGKRPPNLESLVDKRTSDQLDALSKKFKEGTIENDEGNALLSAQNRKILGTF